MKCSGLEVFLLLATHRPEADTQPHLATRGQEGGKSPFCLEAGRTEEFDNCQQWQWDFPFLLSQSPSPRPTYNILQPPAQQDFKG